LYDENQVLIDSVLRADQVATLIGGEDGDDHDPADEALAPHLRAVALPDGRETLECISSDPVVRTLAKLPNF